MTTPGVNELADVATDERLGAVRRRFVNEHDGLPDGARAALRRLVADEFPLLGSAAVTEIVDRLHADLVGLGPVELVLRDPTVTDVLINGPGPIWVERNGVLDVSEDLVEGTMVRRSDGVSTFDFSLMNQRRKYDLVFSPNDRIVVMMKRITWLRVTQRDPEHREDGLSLVPARVAPPDRRHRRCGHGPATLRTGNRSLVRPRRSGVGA